MIPGRKPAHRINVKAGYCQSCSARLTIGEPNGNERWALRLQLSEEQIHDLLQAAAEYRDLCEEAGEYEYAVQFVDWLIPSVRPRVTVYDADGSTPRFENGAVAERTDRAARMHRHPFPLPVSGDGTRRTAA